MKVTCNFCQATAYGNKDELIDKGWQRAIFSAPKRVTITACPDCHFPMSKEIAKVIEGGEEADEGAGPE